MLRFVLIGFLSASCMHQDVVESGGRPVSICDAYRNLDVQDQSDIAIFGVYVSDQLHQSFTGRECSSIGFAVSFANISADRRAAFEDYMRLSRKQEGGYVEVEIVLIGTIRPFGEFGGRQIVVSDFRTPLSR